ncbi:MAG: hypothetical protein ACD_81C00206G0002 [uncultured bacterium]|uniref:Nucleotidase n=1 Tax=Candidatus Wolfebacteria bacterium GW2011_GWE2_44_13 TaxID=1619017 RepID=A0A0G1HAA4_9BACT|nr:MAG: hypothetical protein ACD_81C00206G0002 [uncultured bacterium]KKT43478.1 MAG: hypothetical protein UW32_C0001G0070 [Candidatus Wolfebacteria bacterium GW2011_GWE2_44_13]
MRIGIDIDDVLADTVNAVCTFHNETYGTSLKRDDFLSRQLWKVLGESKEDASQKMQLFSKTGHALSRSVIDGAFFALSAFKKSGHELFGVTARPHYMVDQTEVWVATYFPNIFSEILFCDTGKEGVIKEKKSDICKRLGIGMMIEDDIDHALDCAENGIEVILLDCPWNQGELPENVHRVSSWTEALRLVP